MHHIYQTSGFILSSSNFGEANRSFRILTKDLGFISASAQGVRLLQSKLRYAIHDYAFCDISLVRGKEFWRVVGVSKNIDLQKEFKNSKEMLLLFSRVFALLERLLSGEEKNEQLFKYIEEAVLFAKNKTISKESILNFEYILVLRVLSSLGYLGTTPESAMFIESPFWNDDLLSKTHAVMPNILNQINKSLKETQL
ncbi:MAG: recombination protein O N-terminal domain-containing protein [Patescibacteria group bacterium]